MRRFLFACAIVLSAPWTPSALAGMYDPRTVQGRCAKATGGHLVITEPGKHWHWQTYDIAAWNKCINDAALRETHSLHRRN